MELGNQTFTAPKISRSNISSPLSSGASRISGVTPRLRSSRISFRSSGIGRSSLVSSQSSVETTLAETNQILVEIQNQLALDFALRNAEEKQKNQTLKEEKSKRRFALRESAVESIKKIGGAIKKTASFVAAPVKGFFDQMLEFVSILGLGIGANAVFTWLADEENRKKIGKFFNIIKRNWTLIKNILKTLIVAGVALKLASAAIVLGKVFSILASPVLLKFLAIAGTAAFLNWATGKTIEYLAGGKQFVEAFKQNDATLEGTGVTIFGEYGRIKNPDYKPAIGPGGTAKGPRFLNVMESGTPEQKAAYEQWRARDNEIREIKRARNESLKGVTNRQERAEIMLDADAQLGLTPRAMGGPVSTGRPYLVGEKGPEIFTPNVNGSVVNNFRTEKIYEMISSKGAGKINYITMDLPPIDARQPESTPTPMAPEIPAISSVNSSNPYMSVTPGIYGIYV